MFLKLYRPSSFGNQFQITSEAGFPWIDDDLSWIATAVKNPRDTNPEIQSLSFTAVKAAL